MTSPSTEPLGAALSWLHRYVGFPTYRLEKRAEQLVCIAALAAEEEAAENRRFLIQSRDPAQTSALKAHGLRRSQVHYKCDNSAKV